MLFRECNERGNLKSDTIQNDLIRESRARDEELGSFGDDGDFGQFGRMLREGLMFIGLHSDDSQPIPL